MNTQPEALRLADALQHLPHHRLGYLQDQAATELRRLHAANIDCMNHFNALMDERNELLKALKKIADDVCDNEYTRIARAAIAKATGEQK
jgi:recombinational DNA repair ATPase RecF